MNEFIERHVTLLRESKGEEESVDSLSSFRDASAFVLLGDPGMGKTYAFKKEVKELGPDAERVTARNFITFNNDDKLRGKILFIDGLDEIRSGSPDIKQPLDRIRSRLERLGKPPFRLSCREADWLFSDTLNLPAVSRDGRVFSLRLEPLTDENIESMLKANNQIDLSFEEFRDKAEMYGLSELARNPQTLDILTKAVATGEWPSSRIEAFEQAVKSMAVERNQEHRDSNRYKFIAEDRLLAAAGFLSSLMLLSDCPGVDIGGADDHLDLVSLESLQYDPEALRAAVETTLFTVSNWRADYVHRNIAEYLCARYLTARLNEGLSLGRVLALLTGADGVPVTSLRGVFAWLTALCIAHRNVLLRWDPIGIVLYGDVTPFSSEQKLTLLAHLRAAFEQDTSRINQIRRAGHQFAGFLTKNNYESLLEELTTDVRSHAQHGVVHCVLNAIEYGPSMSHDGVILLNVVHDATWSPGVRKHALQAFIERFPAEFSRTKTKLIRELQAGGITDPDDDLLGILLRKMYPDDISSDEVFDYMHSSSYSNYFGLYHLFWQRDLPRRSRNTAIRNLLDRLVERHQLLFKILEEHYAQSMVADLLLQGLNAYGNAIADEHLDTWLGLALDKDGLSSLLDHEGTQKLSTWMTDHPEIQKRILALHLKDCANATLSSEQVGRRMYKVDQRLHYAAKPSDYGIWCLDLAHQYGDSGVGRYLFETAMSLRGQEEGMADQLERAVTAHRHFSQWNQEIENTRKASYERRQEHESKRDEIREERDQQRNQFIELIRTHIDEIRQGIAHPSVFYRLGMAYFGRFIDFRGDNPRERLDDYFEDDQLVDSILEGLKHCLQRDDLPETGAIFDLYARDRVHQLSFAFLAGIDETARCNPESVLDLGLNATRTAIALKLAYDSEDKDWYDLLVHERPEAVAEILIEYIHVMLRKGKEYIAGVYGLAYDPDQTRLASLVAIPALRRFPVRCAEKQLGILADLLKAAFRCGEPYELKQLVRAKLTAKSMTVGQHTHWLAIGALAEPETYLEQLEVHCRTSSRRLEHLSNLLSDRLDQVSFIHDLPPETLATLIRLIGSVYKSPSKIESGWMNFGSNREDLVVAMTNRMAQIPTEKATRELRDLILNDELDPWRHSLRRALNDQSAIRREAEFAQPAVEAVISTLDGKAPANVADLAALTVDHLYDLARHIRDGSTNDLDQYWNIENQGGKQIYKNRKHEDICRNALLSDLRRSLELLGVQAEKEPSYADDKRPDIKVAFGPANVPIEIKCSDHRDVWHAIHQQLIPKYSRDPGAMGYGTYLVFWFGKEKITPPPVGHKPTSASEMKERLQETLKDERERRQISIVVVDCSPPNRP